MSGNVNHDARTYSKFVPFTQLGTDVGAPWPNRLNWF